MSAPRPTPHRLKGVILQCTMAILWAADLAFLLLGGSTTEVAPHHSLEIRGAAPPGPLGVPSSEVSIGGGPSLEACYTSPSGAVYRPHTPASYYARLASTVVEALQGLAGLNTLELTFFDPEVVAEVSARLPGIQVRFIAQV
jgi:hypothetical protein